MKYLTFLSLCQEPVYNLLLLGTGEAGKTTFVKLMRISNGREFTPEEKRFYRINLIKNVVESIKHLIEGVELLKLQYDVKLEILIKSVFVKLSLSEPRLSSHSGPQHEGVCPL